VFKSNAKSAQDAEKSREKVPSTDQQLPSTNEGESAAEGSERDTVATTREEETISSARGRDPAQSSRQTASSSAARNSAGEGEEQSFELDALASAASAQLKEISSSARRSQEGARPSSLPQDNQQQDEDPTCASEETTRTRRAPKRNRNSTAAGDVPSSLASGQRDESEPRTEVSPSGTAQNSPAEKPGRKKKSNKKKAAAESHNGDGDTQNDSTTGNEGASVNGKAAEGGAGKKRKASAKGKGVSSESNDPNAEPASAVQPQSPTADSTSGSTSKNVNGGRKSEKPRNSRPPSTPEKSVEQRTIRELMRDPSYGMPMSAEGQARAEKRRKRTGEPNQPTSFENDAPESQVDNSSVMAPQVRTVGGRIVIDDSSLTISNATESNLDMSDIVLDQSGRGTNAWSKKRKHCDRWTAEETERFYVGLRKFGLDFQLIASWMGDRRNDRRHVRNKFKKEERLNLARINQAIANRMPVNDEDWRKVKGLGPETLGQNSKIPAQTPGAEEAAGLPGTPNAMEHESGSDLPEDDANESDDY